MTAIPGAIGWHNRCNCPATFIVASIGYSKKEQKVNRTMIDNTLEMLSVGIL